MYIRVPRRLQRLFPHKTGPSWPSSSAWFVDFLRYYTIGNIGRWTLDTGRMTWETIIGLEIHAQLSTESKIFCGCATRFGDEPNANTCPVCLGLPGALPVLNRRAVELGARAAPALGVHINQLSICALKPSIYPDLQRLY